MSLFETIYNSVIEKAKSKHAVWWLSLIAFCEGFFSPIFPDPILAIMVTLNRAKALFYTIICSISSICGGSIGYLLGGVLFSTVGQCILEFYGYTNAINNIDPRINQIAFLVIMAKAFTPIPYKILAIVCGFLKIDFITFIFASFISRFIRFFIVAFLGKKFGQNILDLLEKNKGLFCTIILLSIMIAIWLVFNMKI